MAFYACSKERDLEPWSSQKFPSVHNWTSGARKCFRPNTSVSWSWSNKNTWSPLEPWSSHMSISNISETLVFASAPFQPYMKSFEDASAQACLAPWSAQMMLSNHIWSLERVQTCFRRSTSINKCAGARGAGNRKKTSNIGVRVAHLTGDNRRMPLLAAVWQRFVGRVPRTELSGTHRSGCGPPGGYLFLSDSWFVFL
jgi:hypothetical protein